jgi:hypothetical protein
VLPRAFRAAGGAGNHHRRIAFHHPLENRADSQRIIDNHHPDRRHSAAMGEGAGAAGLFPDR